MALIPINGVRLNVEVVGQGPPVAALHGFTGAVATWESFVRAAQGEHTIISIDLLGHGASDAPADSKRYRMERCIEDLSGLLDYLTIQRVHWLGYSMGGRIALSAAEALPQRTSSLVLESGSPGLATAEQRAARVREDEDLADWIEEVGIERFVEHWEALPLFASQTRLPISIRDRLRAQRLKNRPLGLANSLRGIGTGAQPPPHQRLSDLTAPTLLIAGEEDHKFVAIAQEVHRAIPQSCLYTIPGAGHAAHLEQPERFNKTVLEFLATHPSTSGGHTQAVETSTTSLPSL